MLGHIRAFLKHIKNLEHIEGTARNKKTSNSQVLKFAKQKVKSISARLDIRGTRVEEGLLEVDKYLDDACIAGLSQITIVHGKGTGALRAAIHENLKRHPHVKSFRLGEYGEGDAGITVVQIK
jgi:DNA mismatch repair protein MutS2